MQFRNFMRKRVWAGLLLVLCTTLAFGQRQQRETDWDKDGLQGKVKSIAVKEYIATSDSIQRDEPIESIVKHYDESGYLTEVKEFGILGEIIQRQVFVYTQKRDQCEEILYDEEEKLSEKTITKLNPYGYPMQSKTMDNHGNLQQKMVYEYDGNRLVQQSRYNSKGKPLEKNYYRYNEKGVLYQYIGFNEFENKKILYKYDVNKNPIELMIYDSKTNVFLEKVTQQFDSRKNIIEVNYYDEKGSIKSVVSNKYDEKGNQTEYIVWDSNKNIQEMFTFVYQYDKNNNWINQTVFKGEDKQAETTIERLIEYY